MEGSQTNLDIQALERFVAENDELLALEARFGRFNAFEALDIARREIQHSNFLAWLLRPEESHGQGDLFLKSMLMDLLRRAREQERQFPVNAIHLEDTDLRGTEVHREWPRRSTDRIDLLIVCQHPRIVVVIENKVDSDEHTNQLARYETVVRERFPGHKPLFVLLSPAGEEASDEDWVAYSYADVHRVFARLRRQSSGSMGADVAVFLEHYLSLIGSRFVQDMELDELCQKIYRNHKRALDVIFERTDVGGSGIGAAVGRYFKARPGEWIVMYNQAKYVRVYPKAWIGVLCTEDGEPASQGVDLFFEYGVGDETLKMRCVVGLAKDAERRVRIIKRLVDSPKEFGFRFNKTEISPRWTRIFASRIAEWKEEEPPDEETIHKAVTVALLPFTSRIDAIAKAVVDVR